MPTERESLTESARGLTDRLRSDGRQQIESRKRMAAEQIDEVAQALSTAGEQLHGQPTLASYANQIASSVSNFATRLRDGSIEELIDDTREMARRNPGLFILGSFAAGVALARFLKASERSMASGAYSGEYSGQSDYSGERTDFSSEFAEARATQEEYPSRDYSPSVGTSDQSLNNPRTGV